MFSLERVLMAYHRKSIRHTHARTHVWTAQFSASSFSHSLSLYPVRRICIVLVEHLSIFGTKFIRILFCESNEAWLWPRKMLKEHITLSICPKVKPLNLIRCLHCFDSLFIYFLWSNTFFFLVFCYCCHRQLYCKWPISSDYGHLVHKFCVWLSRMWEREKETFSHNNFYVFILFFVHCLSVGDDFCFYFQSISNLLRFLSLKVHSIDLLLNHYWNVHILRSVTNRKHYYTVPVHYIPLENACELSKLYILWIWNSNTGPIKIIRWH